MENQVESKFQTQTKSLFGSVFFQRTSLGYFFETKGKMNKITQKITQKSLDNRPKSLQSLVNACETVCALAQSTARNDKQAGSTI